MFGEMSEEWDHLLVYKLFISFSMSVRHDIIAKNPYVNLIKYRIIFKIKTVYKLELLSPETMKLLGYTKKRY